MTIEFIQSRHFVLRDNEPVAVDTVTARHRSPFSDKRPDGDATAWNYPDRQSALDALMRFRFAVQ